MRTDSALFIFVSLGGSKARNKGQGKEEGRMGEEEREINMLPMTASVFIFRFI